MANRSLVRCKSEKCGAGVLGSWADGAFYPSGHVVAGRNLYVMINPGCKSLVTRVQCTYCGTWYEVTVLPDADRLSIVGPVVDNTAPKHLL